MENTLAYAQLQDKNDLLASYRAQFLMPKDSSGKALIYFTGNSLGLQPKSARNYINAELDKWATQGVEGHFMEPKPWFSYHEHFKPLLANIIGAKTEEVSPMNSLSVNLHLLLVSFYRPEGKRCKILFEESAFPSDHYVLESQVRHHGLNPEEILVGLKPRKGEEILRTEDILSQITTLGDSLALIMFGGVNYYTGQFFELEKLTAAAHAVGAYAGFDLAHAVGNVPLQLHDWGVDFAAWCSYKYLNSSPGGVSGIFIHEKHFAQNLPRFAGWWGYEKSTRFQMKKGFIPEQGADGWQLSNVPVILLAAHYAALELFAEVGMSALRQKSEALTAYAEFVIKEAAKEANIPLNIITPSNPAERGAQLSLVIPDKGKAIFDYLSKEGVIADWREPDVIRIAPVPFYNTFEEVYRFAQLLKAAV